MDIYRRGSRLPSGITVTYSGTTEQELYEESEGRTRCDHGWAWAADTDTDGEDAPFNCSGDPVVADLSAADPGVEDLDAADSADPAVADWDAADAAVAHPRMQLSRIHLKPRRVRSIYL